MFGANNIVKNNEKEKYGYSGYRIVFDGKGSWIFNDDTAQKVIISGVDNSSSSHTDNLKNSFLILDEGPFGAPSKKQIKINFSKAKTKSCLSLHYNSDNSYLFVNRKKIYKFKASGKSS